MKLPHYKLYVECMTYNQSNYINDALDGFVMQKTSFPYVCCIMDDASTDNNQDVISKYVNDNFDLSAQNAFSNIKTEYGIVTYARHKTNINCYFLVVFLTENHYQKGRSYVRREYIKQLLGTPEYVAYCEGDDYWTNPEKLQMQIDFLDKHPEFVVSCHRCYIQEETGNGEIKTYLRPFDEDMSRYGGKEYFEYDFETFFVKGQWINETQATVARNIYDHTFWKNCRYTRDVHQIFYLLKRGKGVCHSFVSGVYRYNNGSIFAVLDRKRRAETMNGVYTEIYNQTHEPLIINSLIHSRFVMLQCHVYNMKLDGFTLKAWKRYIQYLINNTIHSLIPKRFRRSLKNPKQ